MLAEELRVEAVGPALRGRRRRRTAPGRLTSSRARHSPQKGAPCETAHYPHIETMKTPVAACARELPTLGSKAGFGGKVSRAASRALPQGVGAALVLRRLEDVNPRRQKCDVS